MRAPLSTVLSLVLVSTLALSAKAQVRVAVHDFYGPEHAALRGEVARVLAAQEGISVVPAIEIQQVAHALRADAFSPAGRVEIARMSRISAWLSGTVERKGGVARLTVIVYDAVEHQCVGRAILTAKSAKALAQEVKASLWAETKDALGLTMPPLPPGRGPIDESATARGDAAAREAARRRGVTSETRAASAVAAYRSPDAMRDDVTHARPRAAQHADALRFSLGFGTPHRALRFNQPSSSDLNPAQFGGSVLFDAALAYYPGQHLTTGWPTFFGVDLGMSGAIGSTSSDSSGNQYKARYQAYRAGARARIPLGAHFVSAFAGYAIAQASMNPTESGVAALTPAVDYRSVRSGLGAEVAVGDDTAIALDAAWLTLLSVGDLERWFPRATASGLELALQATYALTDRFFARAAGSYRRVAFDFHSRAGDARIAGGAVDTMLTLSLSAGVSL